MKLPYFPFEITTETYKPSMGLRPLDLKNWIEIDESYEAQITKKQGILNTNLELVLKLEPQVGSAVLETQDLLKKHLETHLPEKFQNLTIKNDPIEALKNISLWVQEDFAFMSPESPSRLVGGCVCFPSRWNLPQKMALGSDGIHAPVPKFKETIAKAAAQFLEKIQVEKPMWRLNWTIHDCPEIFTPYPDEGRSDLTKENILSHTHLRMERQTLRRLPQSQYVLFTIRTYIFPLADVIAEPQRKEALRSTLSHLPLETAHYKGMRKFFDILQSALE